MAKIRVAIVGVGKIVRDEHRPVLEGSADFDLIATASPHSSLDGVAAFPSLDELLAKGPAFDAAVISTTSQARHEIARQALRAGKAVMLEKPPATALSQAEDLRELAAARRVGLYASWHSRHAAGVERAGAWLAAHPPQRVTVTWKEDVRRWHPGQAWVWEAGGLGVFDPGVNALSILTRVLPTAPYLTAATLRVPSNRLNPIAATLELADGAGAEIACDFDWRETGAQTWTIAVEAQDGGLRLSDGGAKLEIDGVAQFGLAEGDHVEYAGVYHRFAEVVRQGVVDADLAPLRLAADAFLIGARERVAPFEDEAR